MRLATVCAVVVSALAIGCARNTKAVVLPAVATEGCPAVLLTRSGGLGFETLGGVLAAVWPSGTIIRAETTFLPSRYMIGRISAADVAALRELAESSTTWGQPQGKAVMEMPDDILTLRRGQEVRQWSETPGFTTTPTVGNFRNQLFALQVEDARGFRDSLKEIYNCAARVPLTGNGSPKSNEDRSRDAALYRHLGLVALEHDARKRLQHDDGRAWRHAEGAEPLGTPGEVARDAGDRAGRSGPQCRERHDARGRHG